MSCGRSLAWLFGVEMAPGTMQHKVAARKQEADTSPRISFLFSFFLFCFPRFGSRWVSSRKFSKFSLQTREVAVLGASQTRLSLGRARRLVYMIAG